MDGKLDLLQGRLMHTKYVLLTMLASLFCLFVSIALVAGAMGVLLCFLLTLLTAGVTALLFAVARVWKRGRRRWLNGMRAGGFGMASVLIAGGFLYSVLTLYRFGADRELLAGNDRYVVVIIPDGASLIQAKALLRHGLENPDQYADAFNDNFPNISRTFLTKGAFTANGISVWPSSSIPAHTGIMTGCYPRHTGVMGQRQFDSGRRRYTSYIGLGILSQRQILSRQAKTMYEYFPHSRSVDVLQVVNRGCSLYVPSTPEDELVAQRAIQVIDYAALLGRATRRSEIPRLLVVTLPGIDHLTHNSLLSDEKSMRAYLQTDKLVGEIFQAYRRAGIFDRTLFVLASDHGMGEVTNHVTLDNLMRDMRFTTYESFKWSVVPAWGSFEANGLRGTPGRFDRVYNALALWGGNSDALLYVKGQSRDGADQLNEHWRFRVGDEELQDYEIAGTRINIIERLLFYSPGVGLIFTNPEKNVFNVYGQSGVGTVRERRREGQLEFQYRVVSGRDPLRYAENPAIRTHLGSDVWLSDQQWISLTYLEHYPDALRRIAYSMQTPNAGTMHIVAADGWDFAPYYVAKRVLVGSHGSLNAEHSLVPIMFYGPGVRHGELPYARTVDILPTVLAYLGVHDARVDGRPLPIFSDEAKNRQSLNSASFVTSHCEDAQAIYLLRKGYASYDQQLVRMDKQSEQETVVLPSLKRAMPELQRRVDCEAKLLRIEGTKLILQQHFVGEGTDGQVFSYALSP